MKNLIIFFLLLLTPVLAQAQGAGTAASIYRTTFANLGTPTDSSVRYCTNCQATSPCTSGGTGAFAYRTAGAWDCAAGGGGGGAGTVTDVSVVTANGLSGTVATSTTTPAITLNISGLDATKIAGGGVTSTEFDFLGSVTSDIQTQLNARAPTASPTFTGTVTIPTPFTLGAVSVTPTGTELNFVGGVTSAIQTQLDARAATGAVGSSGLTMSTDRLLGRGTASTGAIEEITLGTNLSFTGTTLNAASGGIGGTTGVVDNAILRADGVGGATAQNSLITIDDTGLIRTPVNGGAAYGIEVSGQPVVGIGRNSSVGGMNFFGGGTISDTAAPVLLSSGGVLLASGIPFTWSSSNVTQPADAGLARNAAGVVETNNGTPGTAGVFLTGAYRTRTNCADSAGAAACGAAAAGAVVIDAGATSVVVSTTAVTADSQIFIQEDSSLSTRLGVTCNTTIARLYTVTARTAATSFTITTSAAPITDPACLNFKVLN